MSRKCHWCGTTESTSWEYTGNGEYWCGREDCDNRRDQGQRERIAALEADLARERAEREAAEARVRELEAERDRHEARERKLEALGFEAPGPGAHTCGDALGLRRLDEVDKDPPDPAKTSPI